jgi:uncharacterized protein (TIGR03083 family)
VIERETASYVCSVDADAIFEVVERERLRTADLLATLTPEQWDAPSGCEGWRLRDVAAHLTLATRARPLEAMKGVLRHHGRVNAWVASDARERGSRPPHELVAELREAAASRHHPPGTKPIDPLVDIIVHTQDIAVPLGLVHDVYDPRAAAAGAERVWSMGFPFFARRRLKGLRVRAVDAPFDRGTGPLIEGAIAAVLPLLTGRRGAVLGRLHGEGTAALV